MRWDAPGRAFVVTDPVLVDNGTAARITDLLDGAGISWEVFSDVVPNPPVEKVQAGLAAFRASGAEILIGLGGGSPQDTCKAISVIAANPEFADVLSLEGLSPTKNPGVPIIGVPTTAGTASETTINYVITDAANKRKFVCVDPHDIPVVAVVDPDLMDAMPRPLKVATGLDALTHAIEGYITPGAWELSDALWSRYETHQWLAVRPVVRTPRCPNAYSWLAELVRALREAGDPRPVGTAIAIDTLVRGYAQQALASVGRDLDPVIASEIGRRHPDALVASGPRVEPKEDLDEAIDRLTAPQ